MKFQTLAQSTLAALILAACGGGGSGVSGGSTVASNLTLSGTAATGLAIANANVTAKCLTGSGTAKTGNDGSYSLVVTAGALPCVVELINPADSTKLHSIATGTGKVAVANLTPLTELVSARMFKSDPASAYSGFSGLQANVVTLSNARAAMSDVASALMGTVDTSALLDFISTPLVAAVSANLSGGDAQDRLLDLIKTKFTASQMTQLVAGLASNDLNTVKALVATFSQSGSQPVDPSTPATVVPSLPTYTTISDAGFEQALVDQNLDDVVDGKVLTATIYPLQSLIISSNYNISSLVGIESFVSLTKLQIEHNKVLNLDLSKNINLTWLSLWDNKLPTLDVSKLTKLELLGIGGNDITSIDISKNVALKEINFQNDSDGPTPYGDTKGLTSLDISKNVNLERVYIGFNLITSVDVSTNTKLTDFWASKNQITSLDFSKNPLMNVIVVDKNKLSYLNIKETYNSGVPRTVRTDLNPELTSILVTNVAAINSWINQINANVGGVSLWYLHDSWTNYAQ